MGIFNIIDPLKNPQSANTKATDFDYGDTIDSIKTNWELMYRNPFGPAEIFDREEMETERASAYKTITGQDLKDDVLASLDPDSDPYGVKKYHFKKFTTRDKKTAEAIDNFVLNLKQQDPAKYESLKTKADMDLVIKQRFDSAISEHEELQKGTTKFQNITGALIGGGAASTLTDPINAVSTLIPPLRGAGVLKQALQAAAINMGVEVIEHPFIKKQHEKYGHEYENSELITNMLVAGAGGFVLGGAGAAAGKYISKQKMTKELDRLVTSQIDEMPLSTMYAKLAQTLDERGDFEAARMARAESRRLHVEQETRGDLDWETHKKNVMEAEDALSNNRQPDIKTKEDELPDTPFVRSVKESDTLEVDEVAPSLANNVKEEKLLDIDERTNYQKAVDEELKPETIAQRKKDLIEKLESTDEQEVVIVGGDPDVSEIALSKKGLLKMFEDNDNFIKGISVCGVKL